MTDPLLIDAKFLEAPEPKPPTRADWFLILYVTKTGYWTVYRETKSSSVYAATSYIDAAEVVERKRLRHARIVRVEGEGKA